MKQADFQIKLQDHIYKKQLVEFYKEHNQADTISHFNISWGNLLSLVRQEGLQKTAADRHKISTPYTQARHTKAVENLQQSVPQDGLIEYYINQNHSIKECAEYFQVAYSFIIRALKHYGIHKEKTQGAKIIKTVKQERYGDANYNNREAARQTCIAKYGVDNPFRDVDKMRQSYINKLGVDHPMHDPEIRDKCAAHHDYKESITKGRDTYQARTGFDNPSHNPECLKKGMQTKINNGVYDSPGTSGIERRCEKILTRKFGEVFNGYRDERYGRGSGYLFECDFYIPSEDLFIELNGHPSHGKHPYDANNPSDEQQLQKAQRSNQPWDQKLIETWTIRDVEKRQCAQRVGLNYISLYPYSSLETNLKSNDKRYSELITLLIKELKVSRKNWN